MRLTHLVCSFLLALIPACEERVSRFDGGVPGADTGTPTGCSAGIAAYCTGNTEIACNPDGTEGARRDCGTGGGVCAPGLGCRTCLPSRRSCSGNDAVMCSADGTSSTVVDTCDATLGETCNALSGFCTSPCEEAAASNSYIGCEYWPTPTINSGLARTDFVFAVVVSNPQSAPATVTVTRGGTEITGRIIAPGTTEAISLPWVESLQGTYNAERSNLVRGGAYRLRSTLPVTVYQFNPLEFRIGRDCADESIFDLDGQCFSFSNDASLLLPTHVLTGNYLITSFPTHTIRDTRSGSPVMGSSPGFFSVVGTDPAGSSVAVTFSAPVIASTDGSVRAFAAGETGTFTLAEGDVLQVLAAPPSTCTPTSTDNVGGVRFDYCDTRANDLTGSEVRSTGRLSVIGGHNCTFVPSNRWACDHLEESMFPLESWGNEAIVSITQPIAREPNVIRILSSHDANALTFDPASAHAPVTLDRGDFIEFESTVSFRVSGTDAFSVAQYLVGQNYEGIEAVGTSVGDPSLSLAIPTEQFRTSYSFLAPSTFTQSYVNVTAPMGATVTLDGSPVTGFNPVGGTGFGVARVMIPGGSHNITGSAEFGIVVYGFGEYTSYMYPGGLDLEAIDIPF